MASTIGQMKVDVDMSELDEATAKAERLSSLLDSIEARLEHMPPDQVVTALSEMARQHGYGITSLKMISLKRPTGARSEHEYKLG